MHIISVQFEFDYLITLKTIAGSDRNKPPLRKPKLKMIGLRKTVLFHSKKTGVKEPSRRLDYIPYLEMQTEESVHARLFHKSGKFSLPKKIVVPFN
jgi:hypothetical protein